jgi:hypothetical protein
MAEQLRRQPLEAGIVADHHQRADLIVGFPDDRQQVAGRGVIDPLVVARRQAGQLRRLRRPGRGARQDQVVLQAQRLDLLADARRVALAPLAQPAVEILARGRIGLGLGVAKQGQALHRSLPAVIG